MLPRVIVGTFIKLNQWKWNNMTKTIIIGASYQNDNKPIEFNYLLDCSLGYSAFVSPPSKFNYIELICKNYNGGGDLMFAYNDPSKRNEGTLFIGYWNDGVVK